MPGRGGKAANRRADIDFASLAQQLLGRADSYVEQWFPQGRRDGHEWKIGSLAGEAGRSLSINLRTGVWKDFASDEGGGDLLSLYAKSRGLKMLAAARELGLVSDADLDERQLAGRASPPPPPPPRVKRSEWKPIRPVPADAPHYTTQWGHYARGLPARHWEYRAQTGELLGVVCRFETSDGGKDILPLSWCEHPKKPAQWRYLAFAEPRPLYGLQRVGLDVSQMVIVVEGEKCADALYELLGGSLPVVSWPGGGKAVRMAAWTALAGRKVLLWPDHDRKRDKETDELLPPHKQPGIKAMEDAATALVELECEVRIVDLEPLGERVDGWDVADAIAEGWTRERVRDYLAAHLRLPGSLDPTRAARAEGEGGPIAGGEVVEAGGGVPELPDAERWPLVWRGRDLVACTANVHALLMRAPAWRGVIAYDEMAQRIVKLQRTPYDTEDSAGDWQSVDDTQTSMWLARNQGGGFSPSSNIVAETIEVIARENAFHPVQMYLESLTWDGKPRIDSWLVDFLGVAPKEYVQLVSRFYLIGMVKRALQPGCKFDTCLVLEGEQGLMKSSALRVLGGQWFKDTDLNLDNKDAMVALQGAWLYEIAELDSLNKAESSKQKSFLSRQVDEFRPSYGRREIRLPRQVVFAGSTNQWEWLKDPTGGRRFWPVECTAIDLAGLADVRDQLFAEAVVECKRGAPCWPNREQQKRLFDPEQLARQQPEGYVDLLHDWVYSKTADFSLAEAATDCLKLDASKLTRDVQTRVGNALRALGCTRVERRNGMVRFWYRPPTRKAASSGLTHAQQASGEDHGPLPI